MDTKIRGSITLIIGGMFAGKSEELVRLLTRNRIAKRSCIAFRPAGDTRQDHVKSRAGGEFRAVRVDRAKDMLVSAAGFTVIGIDEAQFFDQDLRDVVFDLAHHGKTVIVAALNADFAGKPFSVISPLYAIATDIIHVHAVCVRCGGEASFSQRLVPSQEKVLVGDDEYEARCLMCYEPPSV